MGEVTLQLCLVTSPGLLGQSQTALSPAGGWKYDLGISVSTQAELKPLQGYLAFQKTPTPLGPPEGS